MKSHIQLTPGSHDFSRVIVCGSPERAEMFASHIHGKSLAKNREYHSYLGQFEGKPILITSHGVGSAGAAICFNELIDVGAKKIIRIGTAGGLQKDQKVADLVVATAAARCDGVSKLMVPVEFPAVADLNLTHSIIQHLEEKGWKGKRGVILTSDLFYPGVLEQNLKMYQSAGTVAVEMEISTLFIIGSLRGIQTGAMAVLDGNPLEWDKGNYDPSPEKLKASMELGFQAALRAL